LNMSRKYGRLNLLKKTLRSRNKSKERNKLKKLKKLVISKLVFLSHLLDHTMKNQLLNLNQ